MFERRVRLQWVQTLAGWPLLACAVGSAFAADGSSSGESLAKLKAGNGVFAASRAETLQMDADMRTVEKDQRPHAAILSCADASIPSEVVFHAQAGDLFVVRSAGPVTDRSVLASLEYAVEGLNVPLVVVMGHQSCGIVRAGLDVQAAAVGPNFDALVKSMRQRANPTAASDGARLRAAILDNVEEQINELLQGSTTLRAKAESGRIAIVGGYYEATSGIVHFSEPVRVMSSTDEGDHH